MEKKKRNSLLLMVLLLLIVITGLYVVGTYSKYTAEVSGNGNATVAKWDFENDNAITTINIDLEENYDETILSNNRIAPGTAGSFDINLVNTHSEVGVDFTVALGSVTNAPTNIKFYKDSSYTTELTPGTSTITGQLEAEDAVGKTVTIYWKWEYETGTVTDGIATGDSADTANGKSGSELTIPVTVKGIQIAPSTTAITSHIN